MFRIVLIVCVNILSLMTDVAQAQARPLPGGVTVHKIALTWDKAQNECQRKGTVLASPINNKALNAIKSWMGVKNTMYFIGIRSWHTGTFVSVEGVPFENITDAALDMIDVVNQTQGDCLAMSGDSIRAVSCWSMLPYMCYDTSVYNINMLTCGPDEEGYKYHHSERKCYKAHVKVASWVQAEQICIAEGGHLVVINNDNEARIIKDSIISHSGWNWITTGLYHRTVNGHWSSVHGQPVEDLYNVWHSGFNRLDPTRSCAMFSKEMLYGCNTCDSKFNFICEKEPAV